MHAVCARLGPPKGGNCEVTFVCGRFIDQLAPQETGPGISAAAMCGYGTAANARPREATSALLAREEEAEIVLGILHVLLCAAPLISCREGEGTAIVAMHVPVGLRENHGAQGLCIQAMGKGVG